MAKSQIYYAEYFIHKLNNPEIFYISQYIKTKAFSIHDSHPRDASETDISTHLDAHAFGNNLVLLSLLLHPLAAKPDFGDANPFCEAGEENSFAGIC